MVSSIGADKLKAATKKHYQYAKHRADEQLKSSGVNYTIIRLGGLTNDAGTGKVKLQEKVGKSGTIPREDIASVLVQLLTASQAENKTFELLEGTTEITDVLN